MPEEEITLAKLGELAYDICKDLMSIFIQMTTDICMQTWSAFIQILWFKTLMSTVKGLLGMLFSMKTVWKALTGAGSGLIVYAVTDPSSWITRSDPCPWSELCAKVCPDFTREDWEFTQVGHFFVFHVIIDYMLKPLAGTRWTGRFHKLVFMFRTMMLCFCMYHENRLFNPHEAQKFIEVFGFFWLITDRVIHDYAIGVKMKKYGWIMGVVGLISWFFPGKSFSEFMANLFFGFQVWFAGVISLTVFSWIFSWIMS